MRQIILIYILLFPNIIFSICINTIYIRLGYMGPVKELTCNIKMGVSCRHAVWEIVIIEISFSE